MLENVIYEPITIILTTNTLDSKASSTIPYLVSVSLTIKKTFCDYVMSFINNKLEILIFRLQTLSHYDRFHIFSCISPAGCFVYFKYNRVKLFYADDTKNNLNLIFGRDERFNVKELPHWLIFFSRYKIFVHLQVQNTLWANTNLCYRDATIWRLCK